MKVNLSPIYISDSSSARRQPIVIDANLDPSVNSITAPFKQSRQNGYIFPSSNGKSLTTSFAFLQSAAGYLGDQPTPGSPSAAVPTIGDAPLQVTNLTAAWSGDNIQLTFNFDLTDSANQFFDHINVGLSTDAGTTYSILVPLKPYDAKALSYSTSSQSLIISTVDQATTGLYNTTNFNKVEVATYDGAGQTAGYVEASLPNYSVTLPAPIITESDATSSYTITTTNLETVKALPSSSFLSEIIQEFVYATPGLTAAQVDAAVAASVAAGGLGWVTVGEPRTVSPTSIFAPDGLHRYVRAWFMTTKGAKTAYSNYVEATPAALLPANNLPPANATGVSAAFSNSGAGNDIVVSYTLPTIVDSDVNKPVTIKVKLVPTAANTYYGFFYHTISSHSETSFTIPANLIFSQFGKYYTSYSGTFVLQSQYGTESATSQSITIFNRTSSISSVIPKATITNVIDGYNVQFALGSSGASYGEVYQFFIDPTGSFDTVDMPDYMDATFASGGASGQKTFVVNSISMEGGGFTLPSGKTVNAYVGYPITGTGVPTNTWVTSITGSGPYTITVSNNLTQQAAGSYHMQSLVYSGAGPANVFDNLYQTAYIILRYYDIYDSASQNSVVYPVTPTNPSISVIQNAVKVGDGGSIYVGTSATSGARIVLGPSSLKAPDGTSAYAGIFAFDYGSTSSTPASTAIITNPVGAGYTFETQNAKIADWAVTNNSIESLLITGITKYTGLSASNPNYAFWAGATNSQNSDNTAPFSVTPLGRVNAKNIYITGNGTSQDLINVNGGVFKVDNLGGVTASSASITGSINVNQASTFGSSITVSGYLIVNGTNGAYVKLGSAGMQASPDGSSITTQLSSSPIGTDGVTFATNSAYLGSLSGSSGAWIVKSGKIYSGQLELSSTNGTITAYPTDYNADLVNYGVRIYGGSSTTNGVALSIGSLASSGTGAAFRVDHAGNLNATSATITGTVQSSIIKGGKSTLASASAGYYLDANGNAALGSNSPSGSGDRAYNGGVGFRVGPDASVSITGYYYNGTYVNSTLTQTGTLIQGIPIQGDADLTVYSGSQYGGGIGHYQGMGSGSSGLGPYPRQRMVVEDPRTGVLQLGMAVYYAPAGTNITSGGVVGDLWVTY